MCILMVIRGEANGSVGSTEKWAYLSVRASRVGCCRLSLLVRLSSRLHPHRLSSRPSRPRCRCLSSLARSLAAAFSPLRPFTRLPPSSPTQLLARLYAHLDPIEVPPSPDRLPLATSSPLPHPPDAHTLYCVLTAKAWADRACRRRADGRACGRAYIRSFRACVRGGVRIVV